MSDSPTSLRVLTSAFFHFTAKQRQEEEESGLARRLESTDERRPRLCSVRRRLCPRLRRLYVTLAPTPPPPQPPPHIPLPRFNPQKRSCTFSRWENQTACRPLRCLATLIRGTVPGASNPPPPTPMGLPFLCLITNESRGGGTHRDPLLRGRFIGLLALKMANPVLQL